MNQQAPFWRVENAGLILAAPFIPRLLEVTDVLDLDGVGPKPAEIGRAARLLQFLVDGQGGAPAEQLHLNRLLCGVPPDAPEPPADAPDEPTEAEREACLGLLNSLIGHWGVLGSSRIDALRESFLRRPGRLDFSPDGWILSVERSALDVLVDQLPWSLSPIWFDWMPEPIVVEW